MSNIIAKASEMWMQNNNLTYQKLYVLGNTKEMLTNIIDKLISNLERYKLSANPSSFYIKNQTELIKSLIKVNNVQNYYLYHDYLIQANEAVMDILKRDNTVGIIRIDFIIDQNMPVAFHQIYLRK